MARKRPAKRKDFAERGVPAQGERRAAGMSVSQLLELLERVAPRELSSRQGGAVARPLIDPDAKVADLTVGELLHVLVTGHWE